MEYSSNIWTKDPFSVYQEQILNDVKENYPHFMSYSKPKGYIGQASTTHDSHIYLTFVAVLATSPKLVDSLNDLKGLFMFSRLCEKYDLDNEFSTVKKVIQFFNHHLNSIALGVKSSGFILKPQLLNKIAKITAPQFDQSMVIMESLNHNGSLRDHLHTKAITNLKKEVNFISSASWKAAKVKLRSFDIIGFIKCIWQNRKFKNEASNLIKNLNWQKKYAWFNRDPDISSYLSKSPQRLAHMEDFWNQLERKPL